MHILKYNNIKFIFCIFLINNISLLFYQVNNKIKLLIYNWETFNLKM
jgi:hypothetical protein